MTNRFRDPARTFTPNGRPRKKPIKIVMRLSSSVGYRSGDDLEDLFVMERPSKILMNPKISFQDCVDSRPPLPLDLVGPTPCTYTTVTAPDASCGVRINPKTKYKRDALPYPNSEVWTHNVALSAKGPTPCSYTSRGSIGRHYPTMKDAPAYTIGAKRSTSFARPGASKEPGPSSYESATALDSTKRHFPSYTISTFNSYRHNFSESIEEASPKDLPGHMQPLGSHMEPKQIHKADYMMTPKEFYEVYVAQNKPVIFKGLMSNQDVIKNWQSDDYLRSHFGDAFMTVEYGKKENRSEPGFGLTMAEFLDSYKDENIYMVSDLSTQMYNEWRLPKFLLCGGFTDHLVFTYLWFSSGGTKSVVHSDPYENLHCLISGQKKFVLMEPQYTYTIGPEFDENLGFFNIDVEKVNMTAYPNLAKTPWYQVTVNPGDCFYLPQMWLHNVNSVGRNMGANIWWNQFTFKPDECPIDVSELPDFGSLGDFELASVSQLRRELEKIARKDGTVHAEDMFELMAKHYELEEGLTIEHLNQLCDVLKPGSNGVITNIESITKEDFRKGSSYIMAIWGELTKEQIAREDKDDLSPVMEEKEPESQNEAKEKSSRDQTTEGDDEKKSNEEDLPGHMQPLGSHMEPKQIHKVDYMMTPKEFYEDYVAQNKPVIFKGLMSNQDVIKNWQSDDYLRSHFGNASMNIEPGKKEKRNGTDNGFGLTMAEFLDRYKNESIYMVSDMARCTGMYNEWRLPKFLSCGGFTEHTVFSYVWLSSGGTKSVVHSDPWENLHCLVSGQKSFILMEPQYTDTIGSEFHENLGYFNIDVEKVNMTAYPNLAKTPLYQVTVNPGDCLYLPYLWLHNVNSVGRNMGANIWWNQFTYKPDDCPTDMSELPDFGSLGDFDLLPESQLRGGLKKIVKKDGTVHAEDVFGFMAEFYGMEEGIEIEHLNELFNVIQPGSNGVLTDIESVTKEALRKASSYIKGIGKLTREGGKPGSQNDKPAGDSTTEKEDKDINTEKKSDETLPGHMQPLGSHMKPKLIRTIDHTLTPQEFYEDYVVPKKPVIFKGLMSKQDVIKNWQSDDYLRTHYGEDQMEAEVRKVENRSLYSFDVTMAEFLGRYIEEDIYMVSGLSERMFNHWKVPKFLLCGGFTDQLVHVFVWFSSGGTKSVLHTDSSENLHCLVSGKKKFVLIKPYHAEAIGPEHKEKGYYDIDVEKVNMTAYPNLAKTPWYQVTVNPGDCLYLPFLWIHNVNSIGRNMGVNIWWNPFTFNPDDCPSDLSGLPDFNSLGDFTLQTTLNFKGILQKIVREDGSLHAEDMLMVFPEKFELREDLEIEHIYILMDILLPGSEKSIPNIASITKDNFRRGATYLMDLVNSGEPLTPVEEEEDSLPFMYEEEGQVKPDDMSSKEPVDDHMPGEENKDHNKDEL